MPIKLIPPKPGKTPNYYIRGTYLGRYVDESTGTARKEVARKFLNKVVADIEAGDHQTRRARAAAPTFVDAAISYISLGGERRFIGEFDEDTGQWKPGLITHFGDTKLHDIGQAEIDGAAEALYPTATAATRNRQVYTPMSAILRNAGISLNLKRPKGSQGVKRVKWCQPDQLYALLGAASQVDAEFRIFLDFLAYTGVRLSDALGLTCNRVVLADEFAYLPETKNGDPRGVYLPPYLVASLARHPKGLDRGTQKVFRFRKNGFLYNLMRETKTLAGPDLAFVTFHTLCHTWATWMRRYGGLDTRGLVGTTRWKDAKSAARYEHVVVSEESRKAAMLPTPPKQKGNKFHGNSTDREAVFRQRSPTNAKRHKAKRDLSR